MALTNNGIPATLNGRRYHSHRTTDRAAPLPYQGERSQPLLNQPQWIIDRLG